MAIDTASTPPGGANGARDLSGLRRHVESLLQDGLGPGVYYHDPAHTVESVVPAADRLAESEGLPNDMRELVHAAALLHDTGYIEGNEDHERTSARIASRILPSFGFTDGEVEVVVRLILATKLGTRLETVEECVMADADLDLLGREDFWARSLDLRRELAEGGLVYDELEWTRRQIDFLRGHRYHTRTARRLRQKGKAENLRRLERHLRTLSAEGD